MSMRELIKSTDQRRLALIELLLEANNWMTISEITVILGCSSRNLKEDLSFIRISESNILIESSPLGVRISMEQSSGIMDYHYSILKNTLAFQILEEIFFNETLTVNELAYTLHSSSSTVYRTIEQINTYFQPYNCRIESNPCRFTGDERLIRNYYRAYFKEISTALDWPFRDYSKQRIDEIFQVLVEYLSTYIDLDFSFIDFAFYDIVKLLCTVNFIRYKQGHLVDVTDKMNFLFDPLFKAFKFFTLPSELNVIDDIPVSKELIYQLFYPYFKKGIAYSADAFNKLRKKNTAVNDASTYLGSYLLNFSKEIDIDIKIERLLVMVYGTTYLENDDPNAHYILYNRNKLFALRMKYQFPLIYLKLREGVIEYRKRLNLSLDEDKINLLIYTLFTHWENLLIDLHAQHQSASLLILSDGHFSHAKMIKKLLTLEFSDNITINTYQHRDLSVERLNAYDCDFIISTFKLPDSISKPSIIINHYPCISDIHRIQALINSSI